MFLTDEDKSNQQVPTDFHEADFAQYFFKNIKLSSTLTVFCQPTKEPWAAYVS